MSLLHPKRSAARNRGGVATAEMAVVLPVLLAIVFGTLEVTHRLMLRQSATVAVYETARLAARRAIGSDQAIARGEALLIDRGIDGGRVMIDPEDLQAVPTGDEIRVTVVVPIRRNTPINYVLPNSGSIRTTSTMIRE